MKKQLLVIMTVFVGLTMASLAEAKKATPKAEAPAVSSPEESYNYTPKRKGLGVTVVSGSVVNSTTAVTYWFDLNAKDAIQLFFGINSTSPFTFGAGGHYKHTITGSNASGLHLGGGLGLGTIADKFTINVNGVGGMHFSFDNLKSIFFSVDAGPTISICDGNANFSVGVIGLSIIYLL